MLCPNCKKEIPDNSQACPECGVAINAQPAAKAKKPITKKWWFWVIIVVLVLAVLGLIGGGSKDEKEENKTPVVSTVQQEDNAPVVNGDKSTTAPQTTEEKKDIVLYEANDIKITYVGINDGYVGNEYKLLVENNSSKNVTVEIENLTVNGYSLSTWFYAQVTAGTKKNDTFLISSTDLEDNGIDKIENITFKFHIINSDSYNVIDDSDIISLDF